jgi:hypothetical protein
MTIKRVKEPFAVAGEDGAHRVFSAGDLVDTSDDAYKGREHLFEDLNVAMERKTMEPTSATHPSTPVERATAEPGEKRDVRPWIPGQGAGAGDA